MHCWGETGDESACVRMAQPKVLEVSFAENYAVLSMKNGENRIDMEFLKQFNSALDEIERYPLSCVVLELSSLCMLADEFQKFLMSRVF